MIEFKNISINFKEKIILENFSLKIEKGEKILLSGVSGKGKTTLLKILLGFIIPNSGEVFIDNIKLDENNIDKIRANIGYMPQSTPFLNTKVENLIDTIFKYKRNLDLLPDRTKLVETLEKFDLGESILYKDINQLSGGEKQRLAFIITILLDRKIWVLDEITSSLDQHMKKRVIEYILNSDKTVVMVSHDKTEALDRFRRVIL